MKVTLKDILTFVKVRIAISVAISALLGYVLSTENISFDILYLFFSVFLLASGSAGLNQAQEWKYDEKMLRTMNRPIPRRVFTPFEGFIFSFFFILAGLFIIVLLKGFSLPFVLSILAIVVYNVIYTPLKRVTPYITFPGALVGAIPPLIGWSFSSSDLSHPLILSVSLFFFIWQIPHFWLLLIVYEEDYRNAGFPVLTDILTPLQIARLAFIWIIALVIVALSIFSLLEEVSFASFLLILFLGILLLTRLHKMVKVVQPQKFYKFAFINLNFFVLIVTIVLTFQKILKF